MAKKGKTKSWFAKQLKKLHTIKLILKPLHCKAETLDYNVVRSGQCSEHAVACLMLLDMQDDMSLT